MVKAEAEANASEAKRFGSKRLIRRQFSLWFDIKYWRCRYWLSKVAERWPGCSNSTVVMWFAKTGELHRSISIATECIVFQFLHVMVVSACTVLVTSVFVIHDALRSGFALCKHSLASTRHPKCNSAGQSLSMCACACSHFRGVS